MHRPPVTQRRLGVRPVFGILNTELIEKHGGKESKVRASEHVNYVRVREDEYEREIKHWARARQNAPAGARSLVHELLKISKDIRYLAKEKLVYRKSVQRLKLTTHCLGQFVRHYFGSDIPLRLFAEWMYDCPVFHYGEIEGIHKRHRGIEFSQLEHKDQRYYRYLMREMLRHLLKTLLAKEYADKCTVTADDRVRLFVRNDRTNETIVIIVNMMKGEAVACYPLAVLNKKMKDKSARRKDHYLHQPKGKNKDNSFYN